MNTWWVNTWRMNTWVCSASAGPCVSTALKPQTISTLTQDLFNVLKPTGTRWLIYKLNTWVMSSKRLTLTSFQTHNLGSSSLLDPHLVLMITARIELESVLLYSTLVWEQNWTSFWYLAPSIFVTSTWCAVWLHPLYPLFIRGPAITIKYAILRYILLSPCRG